MDRLEFRNGMPFFGGSLWLDLLNTTPKRNGQTLDFIETSDGFTNWLDGAELSVPTRDFEGMREDVRSFREILRAAMAKLRQGLALSPSILDAVNMRLQSVVLRFNLEAGPTGLRLVSRLDAGASGVTGVIAEDFARFAADFECERLKHCGNGDCRMVFYDTSKNARRRWCSMSLCGNRHKVDRFRARA